jgi:hypothetical protein
VSIVVLSVIILIVIILIVIVLSVIILIVVVLSVIVLSGMVFLKVPSQATALSSFTYDNPVLFNAINKTLNICSV